MRGWEDNMKDKTINKLKIATNILLILVLLISLCYTAKYKQEVKEALEIEETNRLMKIFEEKTNTKCLCADPNYGTVTYIPMAG